MKIAFLFLCRKNILHPSIWKKYFLSQDKSKYNIYIHPDVDENVSDDFFKEYEILEKKTKDHTHTIESRISLLKQALKDEDNEFFVFISEDSVPLQSMEKLFLFLSNKNYTHTFWYAEDLTSRGGAEFIYKNGDWLIINRKHGMFLIEKENELEVFSKGIIGSEVFVASMLCKYNLQNEIYDKKHQLFLEDWSGYKNMWPVKLNDNELEYMESNYKKWVDGDSFFYRKIINPCSKILEFLEKNI